MRRHGKYAYVNGVSCTQRWQTTQTGNAQEVQASCVPDGTEVIEGNLSETGSMGGLGYLPPMPTGEDFSFIGVASADTDFPVYYQGDIVVSETTISIPVKANGPISWSSNFACQGILTKQTDEVYVDSTRSVAPSAKYGKISIEGVFDSSTFTDVTVQNISLTFRRALADSVENGLVYRNAGNLSASLTFDIEDDDRNNALFILNSKHRVRVYVTSTLFYLFDCIHFGEKSNFTVDRTNNSLVSFTVNGMWSGVRGTQLGQIVLPGGSVWWPTSES